MLAGQKKNLLAVAKNWYHQFSIHTLSLIQGNKSVCGFHLGYLDGETELITQAMNAVLDLYKEGKVKPHIDSTWHLEQVSDFPFYTCRQNACLICANSSHSLYDRGRGSGDTPRFCFAMLVFLR